MEVTFDIFCQAFKYSKLTFFENKIKQWFNNYTKHTNGLINWDKIRALLIEREDSINVNWPKCIKKIGVGARDMVNFDTFFKLFKLFRLEES